MERLKIILLFLVTLLPATLFAQLGFYYDFTAVNDDGITLYYKIIDEDNKEVALSANDGAASAYSSLRKLHIPETVVYNSNTYTVTQVGISGINVYGVIFHSIQGLFQLEDIKFPATLKRIKSDHFLGLSHKLKKMVIPAGLESYSQWMFYRQSLLEELYMLPETPPIYDGTRGAFNPRDFSAIGILTDGLKYIYVPADATITYRASPYWQVKSSGGSALGPSILNMYREQFTLSANGYTSYYLHNENFQVPAGCTAYIIQGLKKHANSQIYADVKVKAFPAGTIIPAKTPVILENLSKKGETITYFANISGGTEAVITDNMLVGSATDAEINAPGYDYYIFGRGQHGQGFYWQGNREGESIKLKAHRAGLRIPSGMVIPSAAKSFIFDFEAAKQELTTGISVQPNTQAMPKEDVIYDLQGRRVTNPTRGIYIVNGKKRVFN
jgi:hypothetical protein